MVVRATLADHFMLLVFFVSEKSIDIDHAHLLRNKTIEQARGKTQENVCQMRRRWKRVHHS